MKTPDVHFILINNNGKFIIHHLDEIDPEKERSIILETLEKEIGRYGDNNVRYCRVVPATVKRHVDLG